MEHSPSDYAVGHVRRQDARNVRANHWLLERKENVGYSIQVTARPAPNVRDIQVRAMNRLKMQRSLELMVIRPACGEEAQQASASENVGNGIHDEQVARLAVDVTQANDRVAPQLAVNFDIANEAAGAGIRLGPQTRNRCAGAGSDEGVEISSRRSHELARFVKKTDGPLRTVNKVGFQQGNAVIKQACSGAKDSFLVFSG